MARSLTEAVIENALDDGRAALNRIWKNAEAADLLADDCIALAQGLVSLSLGIAAERFTSNEVHRIHVIKGLLALVMKDLDKRIEDTHAAQGEMKGPLCSF